MPKTLATFSFPPGASFQAGQRVQILNGPRARSVGTVVDYATNGDANKRLVVVEIDGSRERVTVKEDDCRAVFFSFAEPGALCFDGEIPQPGQVPTGKWDRFTTWGWSVKEGKQSEFTEETLKQIIENFVARGILLPLDYNHQSNFVQVNGQAAPSLARYSALAAVHGGRVFASGAVPGFDGAALDPTGKGDGLYGYRCEVTPLGQQLLPNYRYLSPMFIPAGKDEQGRPIGYCLLAVAATDVPFQGDRGDGAPELTFGAPVNLTCSVCGQKLADVDRDGKLPPHNCPGSEQAPGAGGVAANNGGGHMAKFDAKLMKRLGFEENADDAAIKAAYARRMEGCGKAFDEAMEGEAPKDAEAAKAMAKRFEEEAKSLEEEAKAFEDAKFADEPGKEPMATSMRRMARRFCRLAAFAGDVPLEGGAIPAPAGPPPAPNAEPDGDEAKAMSALSESLKQRGVNVPEKASRAVLMSLAASAPAAYDEGKIASLVDQRIKAQREADAQAARAQEAGQLVTMAKNAGAPAHEITALGIVAKANLELAREMAKRYAAPSASPMLFSRLTSQGAPIGEPPGQGVSGARKMATAAAAVAEKRGGAVIFSPDAPLADKAKEYAASKDPVIMARLDAMLPNEQERKNPLVRLITAQKLAEEMHPDMVEMAEGMTTAIAMGH